MKDKILNSILQELEEGRTIPPSPERLIKEEFQMSHQREALLNTLPKPARIAFEQLFDLTDSLLYSIEEYGVVKGIYIAGQLQGILLNPFEVLEASYSNVNLSETSARQLEKIEAYLQSQRA